MSTLAREPQTLRFERYLFDRALDRWQLTPWRITLIYVLFGFLALYFSDVILVQQLSEPLLSQMQAVKGAVEVILTGALILGLTMTKEAQVSRSNDRVRRQQEELLVLHRVLRHNLRNDLNVILGMSEMLSRAATTDENRHRGKVLHDTAKGMLHYTEQAARIRRVTAQNGQPSEVDLVDVVERLSVDDDIPDSVEIHTDLPDSATAYVNHMFEDAIAELVENAIVHTDRDDPEIRVSVDPTAGPLHYLELSVTDNGPGIPEQVISILQDAETDQLTHLQGMGLWFVYWVVSESDGYLIVENNDGGGSTVRVRVPAETVVSMDHVDEAIQDGLYTPL